MHKINYVGFGDSFESVCCNGQAPWEGPVQSQSSPPCAWSMSGEVEGTPAAASSLKAVSWPCVCMVRPSLARGLCFGRWKLSFNAIHGLVLPVFLMVLSALKTVAPVPGGMEGQRVTSDSQWLVCDTLGGSVNHWVGRAVALQEEALSAQHPQPASLSLPLLMWAQAQPCPFAALAATLGCWLTCSEPAPSPKCSSISAQLWLQEFGGGLPCLLRGSLCWTEPSKTLPGVWCLLIAGSNQFSSSWGSCRRPQTEPLSKHLPCPSGKPLQKHRTWNPCNWAKRRSRPHPDIFPLSHRVWTGELIESAEERWVSPEGL